MFNEDGDNEPIFFSGIADDDLGVHAEICPRGVVLKRRSDGGWGAAIRKAPHAGHQVAVVEFGRQLGSHAAEMECLLKPCLVAAGGLSRVAAGDNGDVAPEDQRKAEKCIDADLGFLVEGDRGFRVVVEVEISNRDPLPLAKHAHRLMTNWAKLRCVVAIKAHKRSAMGAPFAAVCFAWEKDEKDKISVKRVFDIGTKKSDVKSVRKVAAFWAGREVDFGELSSDDGETFAVTPVPSPGLKLPLKMVCTSAVARHFTVTVSESLLCCGAEKAEKTDVQEGQTEEDPQRGTKRRHSSATGDLDVDLCNVIRKMEKFKAMNFSDEQPQQA